MLERQALIRARSRAWAKTGKRMAASIAMIAITSRSSIRVNAGFRIRCIDDLPLAPSRRGKKQAPVRREEGDSFSACKSIDYGSSPAMGLTDSGPEEGVS